ncbi:MAG: ABC transporter ATP-binding protein [Eubacteriales bacterium]|nr:ABC transporter ATP-binding protein [Eubacteriales bacterium]
MVELRHVSFRYGTGEGHSDEPGCLSDIDLEVRDGEFVLLTGPSGCGKTTILRLINGLIPHFYPGVINGRITIDGRDVTQMELYETAMLVGTVFQNPRTQFYNVDTTGELAFSCENRGMDEKEICSRVDDTVKRFGMEKLMDRSIFRLSDGEKQKIACASVDVGATGIILLDEPSANLDYESTASLRELIRLWRSQGKTIIAAEHRISYLWDLIDRAVILRGGRIVRELSGREKDSLSHDDLAKMGLRSTSQEDPEEIDLPEVGEDDDIITLRDFRFTYPGEKDPVFDFPRLRISSGEITAITGANGAGKTTFLSCICGLERNCSGIMEYEGRSLGARERQKMCFMVMQDTGNQLFTESVLDEVMISLPKGTRDDREKASEILRDLDLESFSERHPQSLSGGQKQRLAIACALACGRRILLLDEPTSGLDYAHMMQTSELIKKLHLVGATVLVVTHDSEFIRACATRRISFTAHNNAF